MNQNLTQSIEVTQNMLDSVGREAAGCSNNINLASTNYRCMNYVPSDVLSKLHRNEFFFLVCDKVVSEPMFLHSAK